MRVVSVMLGLAALYETVEGFGGGLPFALDADGCVVDYQPNVDYYPPERRAMMGGGAGISHRTATKAEDFSISYHKTYKVVRNLPAGLSYILRHCGTPNEFPDLPADAVGSPVFVVPVKKWSSGLTTTYTFLEELDLLSHAVVLDNTYMSSACGQKLVACGVIAAPPSANWTAAVAASGSEVHFTDKPSAGTAAIGLSIDVAFDASHDPGLLNRAEWLKFAAAFFNKEPEANRVFEDIKSRFEAIVEKVTAKRLAGAASPRVAFVSSPGAYSGMWDGCPYGGYELKVLQGYKAHLVTHGGGTSFDLALAAKWCSLAKGCPSYLCPNATSMKEVLKTIDVVIDETYSATPPSYTIDSFKANYGLTDETSADYPFLASSRVYKTDKRLSPLNGGTDWMESALPHADLALLDFAVTLVPQLKDETLAHAGEGSVDLADFETKWLRNIATGEKAAVVDVSECDDPSAVCPGDPAALSATLPVYNGCDDDFCFTAYPPSPPYSKPSPPPPPPPTQPPIDNSKVDAAGAVPVVGRVLGGILGAFTLGLLVFVCYMYSREKQGNPVFQQMDETRVVPLVAATATLAASETGINDQDRVRPDQPESIAMAVRTDNL